MARSRVNSSQAHDDSQNSVLENNKDLVTPEITEPNTSEEKEQGNDEQSTLHNYEQHRKQEHNLHPHHGALAMIERKAMKTHSPLPVMPTPTSIERRLGAIVFYYQEKPNERKVIAERKAELDTRIEQLAEYLSSVADNKTIEEMAMDVRDAYVKMLDIEGTYRWSTFYRSKDPQNNYKWTFGSSLFFAMNVYTTTGYGSISPETDAGKWFVIVYGFIFVPITLVVIRDLGQWLLLAITRVYARILLKYRRCCGKKCEKSNEVIHLPIAISVLIMIEPPVCSEYAFLGFIGFTTMFVYYYDAISGPPGSGLDWFHSFYFSFMSFTTIGLGDVMPNNATVSR
ncbi:hypothetical protein KIN20_031052 [Parelaphostrongylus tenuis]|uniref:Potassium channel domain-containing protein n=1 Tax=Parelaphostrongylus tenuis TaxID=148309 RepID=A0AAD5R513_PARTN|nr:hypothetical protein KIN20_031052 [Parelaphostrongylus tenuis]